MFLVVFILDASIPPNTTGAEECLVVEYTRDVVLGAYNKIVRGFQNPNDMSCNTENGFICKLGTITDPLVKASSDRSY